MQPLSLYLFFVIFATRKLVISTKNEEIHKFVDGHNSRRLQVAKGQVKGQPGAVEMNIMMWDRELYWKAKAWAAKHPYKHNPNKTVKSHRFRTGENIYWYSTTDRKFKLDPDKALESWFSEHQNYTYGPLKEKAILTIGHYTQLVWSDSIYVGCAISQESKGRWKNFIVVCNYGPEGNYLGERPYKKGGPSSELTCGCVENNQSCDCNKLYGI